ncbi:hypothetical protein [Plantactinospora sp. DSM 117369]
MTLRPLPPGPAGLELLSSSAGLELLLGSAGSDILGRRLSSWVHNRGTCLVPGARLAADARVTAVAGPVTGAEAVA